MIVDPSLPLEQLLTPDGNRFAVPETWQQGRGAFGGLITGTMTRALEASAPERALRSLTAELCGPLQPGDATLELVVLRAGNAVTTTAVRVAQGGEIQAHGVGVLGRQRDTAVDRNELRAPMLPPWRDVPVAPSGPPLSAPFAQHFEYRVVGGLPFSGAASAAEVTGWVRPRRPGTRRDAAYLAACIDAYWPTVLAVEPARRPMATIAFTFQPFAHFDELDPDEPLAYRARLGAIDSGYAVEFRELWGVDGRLLALNQQTFVVIK